MEYGKYGYCFCTLNIILLALHELLHTSLVVKQLELDQHVRTQLNEAYLGSVATAQEHTVHMVAAEHSCQLLTVLLEGGGGGEVEGEEGGREGRRGGEGEKREDEE